MTEKELQSIKEKLLEKISNDERIEETFDNMEYYGMLDGCQIWFLDNSVYDLCIGTSEYIKVNPKDLSYTQIWGEEASALWPRIKAENPELHTREAREKREAAKDKRLKEYGKKLAEELGRDLIP